MAESNLVAELGSFWLQRKTPGVYILWRSLGTRSQCIATIERKGRDEDARREAEAEMARRHQRVLRGL